MDKPRVLVADDSDAICALLKALLQRDYHVEIASNGSEALERIRTRSYRLVLLDLLMPETDGFAVLRFLGTERPDLLSQVIVLTAAVTERELERARAFAVHDIIRKPFEVETLLSSVQRCVSAQDDSRGGPDLLSSGVLLLIAGLLSAR